MEKVTKTRNHTSPEDEFILILFQLDASNKLMKVVNLKAIIPYERIEYI